ncbi:hypothetical protein Tco_1110847 [Tanacetum coccineum]|uniref:CCHC-type domain-containing protein n=1 Tax=Tanacetum coccineum TaxID=301880 RepID=A0ABQ5IMJ0_9ASTR
MEELRFKQFREDRLKGQAKVIYCYSCQEEGYMARLCTKPKRQRNSAWFKQNVMLAEALESRVVLDEEQMALLAENGDIVTDFENQIHSLKQQVNATVESHETLSTTVDILKIESKEKEDKYLEEIIELENKKKALDNVVYKMELAEESSLKMHAKENDPIAKEKKVNIAPIDYVALNKLFEHFVKHIVPSRQLFVEQAFWLPISKPISKIALV